MRIGICALAVVLGCEANSTMGVDEDSTSTGVGSTSEAEPPLPIRQGGSTPTTDPIPDLPVPDDGPPPEVRFVALGDGGEGNDHQFNVAAVMEEVCEERGCMFALYLGDNFYDLGVDSTMDVQFQDKFELPYADIDFPFYVALGNHDYGTFPGDLTRSKYQVEYTEYSDKWTLPHEWYSFTVEHVAFIGLDTARMFISENIEDQRELVRSVLAQDDVDHVIAFGHHPYISNGAHGNAGNYDNFPFPGISGLPIKDFFDEELCGKLSVYFCGHDHNRQWHPTTCGTEFIVSGAAAKTKDFEHRDDNPPVHWEEDQDPGFAWVEIIGSEMTVAFYDEYGDKNFEDTITLP